MLDPLPRRYTVCSRVALKINHRDELPREVVEATVLKLSGADRRGEYIRRPAEALSVDPSELRLKILAALHASEARLPRDVWERSAALIARRRK